MIGKRLWDELDLNVRDDASGADVRRAMEQRVPVTLEVYHPPSDAWYLCRFEPLPDGGLTRYVQDITESKRHEQQCADDLAGMLRLQEVSTRLVSASAGTSPLQDIVDAAIAITGADMGLIQLIDRESGSLTIVASRGFERPFLEFFALVADERLACGAAMHRGERVVVEDVRTSPIFRGEPSREAVLEAGVHAVQSTPLVARSGTLVGVLSTHYRAPRRPAERDLRVVDLLARQAADWIERTHAETAARESEERYRSLVAQVREYAIFSTDGQAVITSWNEGCEQVLGYAEAEFVGLDSAELFTSDDRESGVLAEHMRELVTAGTMRDERWMLAKDGRRFFAMGVATALHDLGGRLIGYSVVMRDMTQMKLAQETLTHRGDELARLVTERTDALEQATARLRVSERMASLGTLAAGLGHDLGNLLLPLEVRLQFLMRSHLTADLRDHVDGIVSGVQYLQRLSSSLRMLATDPTDTRLTEPTELGAWWQDTAILLKNVLPRSVTFEGGMPLAETWVSIGRVGLTQAVFNVVQNAADALKERAAGRVTVTVDQGPRAGTVAIRVTDDGPGMTEDDVRRCTEPYFSTKARAISTGMGLALVHGLVTAAGGDLQIASTLGAGTTVNLVLPGARLPQRPSEVVGRVAVVRIRDARLRSFVRSELRTLGFDVRTRRATQGPACVLVESVRPRDPSYASADRPRTVSMTIGPNADRDTIRRALHDAADGSAATPREL